MRPRPRDFSVSPPAPRLQLLVVWLSHALTPLHEAEVAIEADLSSPPECTEAFPPYSVGSSPWAVGSSPSLPEYLRPDVPLVVVDGIPAEQFNYNHRLFH